MIDWTCQAFQFPGISLIASVFRVLRISCRPGRIPIAGSITSPLPGKPPRGGTLFRRFRQTPREVSSACLAIAGQPKPFFAGQRGLSLNPMTFPPSPSSHPHRTPTAHDSTPCRSTRGLIAGRHSSSSSRISTRYAFARSSFSRKLFIVSTAQHSACSNVEKFLAF